MYNHIMTMKSYQILLCNSCGLRYPHVQGQSFGTRCPICMGETRVILSRELILEPSPTRPLGTLPKHDEENLVENSNSSVVFGEGRGGAITVLLDNIRSAWNVGSILRSADGFGFDHAYLCGITPTPENEAVAKTSLGAEDSVTWSYHKDAVKLVNGLKKEGWKILGLEEDERAKELIQNAEGGMQNTLLIVGNEVTGVDPGLLDLCDEIFYIPMRGEKKSFNVGIAFGIAAYALNK
jgi:23S rRNA (guanosine2251-2'-O)-methyltransferase